MNRRKRKVLVTGASGFLGSHICEAAHEAGYEVHAIVRKTSSREWLNHDWITIHVAELDDREALSLTLKGIDAIVHAAAKLIGASEEEFFNINVEATRTLAEEACKAGVERFVFVSSRAAGGCGNTLEPKKETDPDRPLSGYGWSKKHAEEKLFEFRDKIKVISLRYVIIYGPRDKHLVRLFRIVNSNLVPLIGTEPIYTPMVYVRDAAYAVVAALQANVSSGSIYYISDGIPYTLDIVFDLIAAALGIRLKSIRIPVWLGALLMGVVYGARRQEVAFTLGAVWEFRHRFRLVSPGKARVELDWQPQVTAHEGFAETVKWYRQRGWL
jgi:nucleoside-diphosphate-sugar epimerase